jgi:serine/threonine-protein kinase RsbW
VGGEGKKNMCSQNKHSEHQLRVVTGTRHAFDDIQQEILSAMEECGFIEDDLFAVRISLEEALANALLHGHLGDSDFEIKITWLVNELEVECSITDQGRGYDPDSIPDPTADENLTLPSGRGLAMIRAFMDEVYINEQGNSVMMKRYKIRQSDS